MAPLGSLGRRRVSQRSPACRGQSDGCHGPAVLVCVTDLQERVSLPEQRLRDLFDLTPAETRVAVALFEGLEPKLAADKLEISVWTVRRHLAEIFAKTQTGGQVELARLMMRTIGAREP